MFPLGARSKQEVRGIARRHGLEVAEKPESQEICFVPDGDYAGFVERHAGELAGGPLPEPGDIVDTAGRRLGRHGGIHRYTVGQRRGLGIAHSTPLYVVALEPESDRVVVGERGELASRGCRVVSPNWIALAGLEGPVRAEVKIRSRHPGARATIEPAGDDSVTVSFDEPQLAVTPGQAAVFYRGDAVLGGGWIARDGS
jgi:tRNA-specific 2-thiouridylase